MSKQFIEERIAEIAEKLRDLDIKLDLYAERDRLAYGVHYETYKTLDQECLDLMTQLQAMEEVCPPDHSHLTNEDKEI